MASPFSSSAAPGDQKRAGERRIDSERRPEPAVDWWTGWPGGAQLGSKEGIKEAAMRSVGMAVLATSAVPKELRSGTLLALAVTDLGCAREMVVVLDQRRVLPLPARLLLTFLAQHPVPASPLSP